MNLLLISNSTMAGEEYLFWPGTHIQKFLSQCKVKKVCFVPFAGVSLSNESLKKSYDVYTEKVKSVFNQLGYELASVHQAKDPVALLQDAEAIIVGGGNTFHLVAELQKSGPEMIWHSCCANGDCREKMILESINRYFSESFFIGMELISKHEM